jgi:uncharacterized protein (TIGR02611 family)
MRSPIKRLFSHWHLDNIKVVRRVIASIVGATVLLIGIALLVLPGPAFVVIPVGLAILATEYAWARRWLRKVRRIASDVVSGREQTSVRDLASSSHRGEHEKRAANCAEDQAHNPKTDGRSDRLLQSKSAASYYSAIDFDVHSIGTHAECTPAQIVCVLTASNSEV